MNEQKIDFRGQIHQQNHGLVSDCNFELSNHSSQFLGVQQQQPWNNMGIWVQQLTMDDDQIQGGSQSQLQNLGPAKSPSSIMSRFESPASAFYATERCMRFPQYDSSQVGNLASQFPSGQSYDESYSMDSSEQAHADPNFDIRNTLQSVVKSQPNNSYQYFKASEKSNQIPLSNLPGNNNLFTHQQNKLHGDRTTTASVRRPFSPPYKENQDQAGCCNSFTTSPVTPLSFYSQQGKQSPKFSTTYGDSSSSSPALSSKTRIRWNQDLHEKFVECVNRLGGADKATPKAILKMMGLDGLTIFHVKSHLQKYRIAKYMPDSAEGKSEKKTTVTVEPQLDVKTLLQPYDVNFSGSGLHIKEALQLQLDVQRRLHEQLEIQRKLQLRIEEQGKQLKMMFDLQQKSSNSLLKTQNLDITCHEDGPSNTLSDIQVSTPEDSGSTHFPSKIS